MVCDTCPSPHLDYSMFLRVNYLIKNKWFKCDPNVNQKSLKSSDFYFYHYFQRPFRIIRYYGNRVRCKTRLNY